MLKTLLALPSRVLSALMALDFTASLLLRAYLVPVFYMASTKKWNPLNPESSLDGTIRWFDKSLGLPYPELMAYLAWGAEYVGWILLALGLAVRFICLPLLVTMVVAAVTVHLDNGWLAIAQDHALFATERTEAAVERLGKAKRLLKEHGDYGYLTEHGRLVMLNNGIEFAATYFVMLLALFFLGAGRFVSVDYWLAKRWGTALSVTRRAS